jgi:hypothetical protein
MEQQEKLKLLRGLYFLSQDEMSHLAKCQRSYYAAAESKNKTPLLEKQAASLQRHLVFDSVWFAGTADKQPLISNRLLLINMDWEARLLGVTANVRSSRIKIAESAVTHYLPKMLVDVGVVACYRAEAPGGGRLILFLLNSEAPQLLILCVVAGQNICKIVEKIAAQNVIDAIPIAITDNEFAAAIAFSQKILGDLLTKLNLAKDDVDIFKQALSYSEDHHFDYESLFGNNAREIALRRILHDMETHGISVSELAEVKLRQKE